MEKFSRLEKWDGMDKVASVELFSKIKI